jgi:hypothetical protein
MILTIYVKVFLGASLESQKLSIFHLVILFKSLFKSYDADPLCKGILWRQPGMSEAVQCPLLIW